MHKVAFSVRETMFGLQMLYTTQMMIHHDKLSFLSTGSRQCLGKYAGHESDQPVEVLT